MPDTRTDQPQHDQSGLQPRQILKALRNLKQRDLKRRLPDDLIGVDGEIALLFNENMEEQALMNRGLLEAACIVGQDGNTGQRIQREGLKGAWAENVDATNRLIGDLVRPINAVAQGDLSREVALEIAGRPLQGRFKGIAATINAMVRQLKGFAEEVIRVTREVGTEGKLGGQARVEGV